VTKYLIVLFGLLLSACSEIPKMNAPLLQATANQLTSRPFGAANYCSTQPAAPARPFWDSFCGADAAPAQISLTDDKWAQLRNVNSDANAAIRYMSTNTWDPLADVGDCKTYASRKELELLDQGWPAGAMRLATAFINDHGAQQYAYHAVLLVDTDHGTIVLDVRQQVPVAWADEPYIWIMAEVPGGNGEWTRLPANPRDVEMALAANGVHQTVPASALVATAETSLSAP
jgi:predicted transglutaminase-like cysteine proteinase